jgi:hypothetical protein
MDLTGVIDFFGIDLPFIKEFKNETLNDLPSRYRQSSRVIEGKFLKCWVSWFLLINVGMTADAFRRHPSRSPLIESTKCSIRLKEALSNCLTSYVFELGN